MKVKDSKWVRIYEALVEEIKTGRYNKGERLFTRQELCERFGVSDIVVRRALDELRREGLIINKPRVGVIVAKNLEIEEIRVFVGDVWDRDIKAAPFTLLKIISGIEEEARSYGIRIQYINSRTLAGIYGDVIISFYDFLYNHIADYKGNNTYIILHPPKRLSSHHTVRHGLFEGGYIATKHLISRGYKKIGYIGSLNDDWYIARFQGCLEALKEDNLGIPMEYLKEVGEDKEEVCNAIESLLKLKHPPDALFCVNDIRAIHIIEYCNKKGIKIPEEIAVCGFDNISEAEISNPPLTTVDTNLKELGREAVRLVLRIMEGEVKEVQDIVIQPELITRKST